MKHFNALSAAEAERLSMLIEECAKVIHSATKILRHGYNSQHPNKPYARSNREDLEREIYDLIAVTAITTASGDIKHFKYLDISTKAMEKLKFTHHQQDQDQ